MPILELAYNIAMDPIETLLISGKLTFIRVGRGELRLPRVIPPHPDLFVWLHTGVGISPTLFKNCTKLFEIMPFRLFKKKDSQPFRRIADGCSKNSATKSLSKRTWTRKLWRVRSKVSRKTRNIKTPTPPSSSSCRTGKKPAFTVATVTSSNARL